MRSIALLTPLTLAAALGMLALPATAQTAPQPRPTAKPTTRPGMQAPAKPAPDCCGPGATCCAPGAACCVPGAHGAKDKAKPGADACCPPDGKAGGHAHPPHGPQDGHGHSHDGHSGADPHAMPHGHRGMHGHDGPKARGHRGDRRGMRARMAGTKVHELRYMPAASNAGGNSYMMAGWGFSMRKGDWLSAGMQGNTAIQLNPAPGQGHWFAHYGGVLPKLGADLGPARLDVGSLFGLGGMARTTSVGGTSDVLQFRAMWVVEPRLELGWKGDRWGGALVGTYLLTPNMTDLGGPTVGLQFTWGGGRGRR